MLASSLSQVISSWQYINSIKLWTRMLATYPGVSLSSLALSACTIVIIEGKEPYISLKETSPSPSPSHLSLYPKPQTFALRDRLSKA